MVDNEDYIIEIDRKRAIELIEKYAGFLVEKRLGAAAIMTIESLKPLAGISSQALHAISPFIEIFFKPREIQELAALLDKREYVDLLIKRIDEIDEEMHHHERQRKRKIRKRKRKVRKEKILKLTKKLNIFKNKTRG